MIAVRFTRIFSLSLRYISGSTLVSPMSIACMNLDISSQLVEDERRKESEIKFFYRYLVSLEEIRKTLLSQKSRFFTVTHHLQCDCLMFEDLQF